MTPERLLEHVALVQAACDAGRERTRRKLERLDKKIAAGGHDHLKALRAKTKTAAGGR